MAYTGAVVTPRKYPDQKQPSGELGSRATFFLFGAIVVDGLVHARAIGVQRVVSSPAPVSLVHDRSFGAPPIVGTAPLPNLPPRVYRSGRLSPWPVLSEHRSRAVWRQPAQTAQLPQAPALVHARAIGQPRIPPFVLVSPLAHARALGTLTIRIPLIPGPPGLVRVRLLGAVTLIGGRIPHPTYIYPRTLRAARRRGRWR